MPLIRATMLNRSCNIEDKFGRGLFSAVIAVAFAFMFGPAVMAEFARIDGPVGWGNGYGHGHEYGYGWDGGTYAGVMNDAISLPIDNVAYRFTPNGDTYDVSSVEFDPYSFGYGSVQDVPSSEDDDTLGDGPYAMPFDFDFFGEAKTQFWLSSNGFLSFSGDDDGCCDGEHMPGSDEPNDSIAAAWMDLSDSEGYVGYQVFGEAPDRVLVAKFARAEYGSTGATVDVQVHIHEGSGIIEIHTAHLDSAEHYVTQGLENSDGTVAVASPNFNRASCRDEGECIPYGFGYGLMLPLYNNQSVISYDDETDVYDIAAVNAGRMVQAGLAEPLVDSEVPVTPETAFGLQMLQNVRIHAGRSSIMLDRGTIIYRCDESTDITSLTSGSSFSTEGLSQVRGRMSLGFSGTGLCIDEGNIEIKIFVGGSYNGQELNVNQKAFEGDESGWDDFGTCVVSRGYCVLEELEEGSVTSGKSVAAKSIHTASYFESIGLLAVTGGRASSSGGGSYNPPIETGSNETQGTGGSEQENVGAPVQGPASATTPGGVTVENSKPREEINKILPSSAPADSLVKLADDGDPSTSHDTTVYYIGLDGMRHPFPSRVIYQSWYEDFSSVRPISAADLASIPLGAPILVRPGTHFVKIVSDPKTYYVEPGYKLRWIKDEAAATMLGGADWARNVIDIDPAYFSLFDSTGETLTVEVLSSDWPAGALVSLSGSSMSFVTNSGRRAFVSEPAFQANHFQHRFVWHSAGDLGDARLATITALPTESPISGFEDALFSLMH